MQQAAPGWYADPYDAALERAWDGSTWTTQTRMPPPVPAPPTPWGAAPVTTNAPVPTWRPPTRPSLPGSPSSPSSPAPTPAVPSTLATDRSRVAVIVGAIVLPLIGFAAGYIAHGSHGARPAALASGHSSIPGATTGTEPAGVNVPGPTAPPGVDTAGIIAEVSGGVPQVRPETKWSDQWPAPTS